MPESGGKTTLAIMMMIEFQKQFPDKYAYFVDVEHSFNPEIAVKYGIDLQRLIVSQPDTGEEALDLVEAFARSGQISIAVIDSVSALLPTAEAEEDMGKQSMGLQSRLMSKALRKLTPVTSKNECTVIFLNQIREKIGVMYGNPETVSGGRALAFYASIRINVRAGEKISVKDNVIGHIINVKISKNKTFPPFKNASFPLIYAVGVDKVSEIADIIIQLGVVDKGGAWLRIKGEDDKPIIRKFNGKEVPFNFQGKEKFIEHLREDTELYKIFEEVVYGKEFDINSIL